MAYQPAMLLAILPEISLVVLAAVILAVDLVWREKGRRNLGWVTAAGLLLILVIAIIFARPGTESRLIFGGMLSQDGTTFVFRLVFIIGAALTALFMTDHEPEGRHGEFYLLLLVATLGMNLMAASADLIMLYLAIEMTSLPLYVMAGAMTRDPKSTEAGIKYFLFGAMTSAIMLYGFSLLYGFTGTTSLYAMAEQFRSYNVWVLLSVVLVLVGFGFKVSAVPLHFWAPDVYEGAPTPVAGFLSTASKAAGFAVLMRLMMVVFPNIAVSWTTLVAILSGASMIVGNILAIVQKNIKRLLAYSSIAQAGYILLGVCSANELGYAGATYYLISYLVTNLAAFGIVALIGRSLGSDSIESYSGLHRRSPGLAMAFLIALLSLGGIPPFSGFVGKLLVIGAAIQAGWIWLAFLAVITSVIGLYYYLIVLRTVFTGNLPDGTVRLVVSPSWEVAILICMAGIFLLGIVFSPWYSLASFTSALIP